MKCRIDFQNRNAREKIENKNTLEGQREGFTYKGFIFCFVKRVFIVTLKFKINESIPHTHKKYVFTFLYISIHKRKGKLYKKSLKSMCFASCVHSHLHQKQ